MAVEPSDEPQNGTKDIPWWKLSSRTAKISGAEVQRRIDKQAEKDGIRRPKGYTVSYHYNPEVEQHHFGRSHPMKPWRLQLTKQLILSYGLNKAMDSYQSMPATKREMCEFHDEGYVDFLKKVTPENKDLYKASMESYAFGDDCPVFDGLYEYCELYTGATVSAARNLTSGQSDIAINWSGGLHHAKKSNASGFCYVNDIVLAICELCRHYSRILYIDIDVHHGDGVEQAFFSSNRVMTLSFHKFDKATFFPGTGSFSEQGPESSINPGAHHGLNVPLKDGIDDDQYTSLFKDVVSDCVNHFQPSAIVLQCGADSLGGDRLGKFNLNIRAHGECVAHVKRYKLPLLILGGGGYTPRNVARLWCHETSLLVGAKLGDHLPVHIPYRQAFEGVENGNGGLYPELHNIETKRHDNQHDNEYLAKCRRIIREHLRYLEGAPSVQMERQPRDLWKFRDELNIERQEQVERRSLEKAGNGRDMELD